MTDKRLARRVYGTVIPAGTLMLNDRSNEAAQNGLHFTSFRYENIVLVSPSPITVTRSPGLPLSFAIDMARKISAQLGETPVTKMLAESLVRVPEGVESYEFKVPAGNVLFFVNASRSFGLHEQAAAETFRVALTDAEFAGITSTERWLTAESVEQLFSDNTASLGDAEERDADEVRKDSMLHGMLLLQAMATGDAETKRMNEFFGSDDDEFPTHDENGVPIIRSEGSQRHAPVPLWVLGHMTDGGGRCFHTKVASLTAPVPTETDEPDENGCIRKWTFTSRCIDTSPAKGRDDYVQFTILNDHVLGGRTPDVFMEPAGTALYPEDVYRALFDDEANAPEPERWYDESEVPAYNKTHIVMPGEHDGATKH